MEAEERASKPSSTAVFPPPVTKREEGRLLMLLRTETIGGALLVIAAVIGIVWANSPWSDIYFNLRDFEIGYAPLGLQLSLGQWASDGLLAIFFFLVGLELKREFVTGSLRKFSTAVVPITAAAGGVIVPAIIYSIVVSAHPELHPGWAIPTATDIAFAVSVLALIGSNLPSPLRIFLLTLAVVDDLIAIGIIAFFYSHDLKIVPLLVSFAVIAIYGFIAQRYRLTFALRPGAAWFILFPIGIVAWAFMLNSGIHPTISGVLLAFTVPVKPPKGMVAGDNGGLAGQFEYRFGPLAVGFAVPIFAFFSAGVDVGSMDGFLGAVTDPVTVGIVAGLVLGKPIGITLTTFLMTRFRSISLDDDVQWIDLFGLGVLAGIGFTVALLVAELSFPITSIPYSDAKVGILTASVLAIILSSMILIPRNRYYGRLKAEKETQEENQR